MVEIKFSHYGELREVNATDGELEIFEVLQSMTDIPLELIRRSDSYVTAASGDYDIARFKFTDRAKWICFPLVELGKTKNRFTTPSDVKQFSEKLSESIKIYRKYN